MSADRDAPLPALSALHPVDHPVAHPGDGADACPPPAARLGAPAARMCRLHGGTGQNALLPDVLAPCLRRINATVPRIDPQVRDPAAAHVPARVGLDPQGHPRRDAPHPGHRLPCGLFLTDRRASRREGSDRLWRVGGGAVTRNASAAGVLDARRPRAPRALRARDQAPLARRLHLLVLHPRLVASHWDPDDLGPATSQFGREHLPQERRRGARAARTHPALPRVQVRHVQGPDRQADRRAQKGDGRGRRRQGRWWRVGVRGGGGDHGLECARRSVGDGGAREGEGGG